MAKNTFTSWMANTPMGQQTGGVPGHASNTFPINNGPEPWFRDRLDALRSGRIATPSAQYPDGYLQTVRTRREDRLIAHGGGVSHSGETKKSYERGIHVGARVSPNAYFWNDDMYPQLGLDLQAEGSKFAPQGEALTHLGNDGKPGPARTAEEVAAREATRYPRYRSG